MYTNFLICSRFPEIVFAQNSGINKISAEFMRSQPAVVQSYSLKLIGILLFNSIKSEKAIQATQEAGKIAINQAIKNFIPDIFGLRHQ